MKVFMAFLAWPLVEIALSVLIGGWIGLWPTLIWVVLSALLGIAVMRHAAARQAMALREGVMSLRDPARFAAREFLSVVAGILLILPGFLTDALGLLLLLPPVQALVAGYATIRFATMRGGSTIIEGEFTEVRPSQEPPSGWTRIE